MSTEEQLTKQVERLKEKLARKTAHAERLKVQNDKLKDELSELKIKYRKLLAKKQQDGTVQKSAVKKVITEHYRVWSAYQTLVKSWNLRTRNNNNVCKEMLAIISPDENGIQKYTEQDLVNYISCLVKFGKQWYLKDEVASHYYPPDDSLVLFKHYPAIRKIILKRNNPDKLEQERLGYKTKRATANGIEYDAITVVCSVEDLKKQRKGQPHVNDDVPMEKFKGDDRIHETERRRAQRSGYVNWSSLQERYEYIYKQVFGSKEEKDIIVLNETPIIEDDDEDDLNLSDFEEVK